MSSARPRELASKVASHLDGIQGVVLAAGFGTRLRPLTAELPKPLVPFMGIPCLHLNLEQLRCLGLRQIMVNAHYLPEQVAKALASYPGPVELSLSVEPDILGTGGAFAPMRAWRQSARALLVLNGDVISGFPLAQLLAHHEASQALATMALLPQPHRGESAVWCVGTQVVAIGGERPHPRATAHGFACAQVLSAAFLDRIDARPLSIMDYYRQALQAGAKIEAVIEACFWYDLGTPQAYWEAQRQFLRLYLRSWQDGAVRPDPLGLAAFYGAWSAKPPLLVAAHTLSLEGVRLVPPVFMSGALKIHAGAQLGPFVVAVGAGEIGAEARVKNCLLYGRFNVEGVCQYQLFYDQLQLALR